MLGDVAQPIGGAADVYSLALVLRNALDPRLAKPADTSEITPLLRERARQPATLSRKRELRYMVPQFRRWLSQDPNKRPTAAELADELAILTAPEERRQARLRFIRRATPALLLLGLMISGLAFQLLRKETALVVQGRELQQQRQVGEVLRRQSAAQVGKLGLTARELDDERRLREQAGATARQLNVQLTNAARRYEELDRRQVELTAERDELALDSQRLTAERDALGAAQRALAEERATLVAQHDELSAEVARITGERDDAVRAHDKLSAEGDRARAAAEVLAQRIDALTKEADRVTRDATTKEQSRELIARELRQARTDIATLERKLAQAKTDQTQLERQVRELKRERAVAAPRAAAARKASKRPRARARPRRR